MMINRIVFTTLTITMAMSICNLAPVRGVRAQTADNTVSQVHYTAAQKSTDTVTAIDDPGKGRLSGDNIPEEFYDNNSHSNNEGDNDTNAPFYRYGSSQSLSPYTGKTYTHLDQFDGYTIVHGVDVSDWQNTIDWSKVKAAGIDFALIRAGYRGYSAGTLNNDAHFDTNMDGAAAVGIKTGMYIFSQAITEEEAVEEANFLLGRIGKHTVNMPIVLDYEFASTSSGEGGRLKSAALSKEDATKVCLAFCKTIADAGYTPMVYANKTMLTNYLDESSISSLYPIWLANYTTSTTYSGTFSYWQYSSSGKVDGISGNADMNFYYAPPVKIEVPAVTGLTLKKRSTNYITLKWDKQSNIDGYEIYRSTAEQGNYSLIKTITSASTNTFKNKKLSEGVCYYYKIRAYKKTNTGTEYSNLSAVASIYTDTSYTRLALAKDSTNVLNAADVLSGIIDTPNKNTVMKVTYSTQDAAGNTWYHVTYDTVSGFVKAGTVTIAKQGKVKGTQVNVRKSHKITSKRLTTLKKNTKVIVLKTKKVKGITWYNVRFNKKGKTYKGWISAPYVKL